MKTSKQCANKDHLKEELVSSIFPIKVSNFQFQITYFKCTKKNPVSCNGLEDDKKKPTGYETRELRLTLSEAVSRAQLVVCNLLCAASTGAATTTGDYYYSGAERPLLPCEAS